MSGFGRDETSVKSFYEGKSVFITGSTGFLGTVLLEALLRCCPGINYIFVLIREKDGKSPEERLGNIFNRKIFFFLRNSQPESLKKVHVVTGDLLQPNLGIGESDLRNLKTNVSIVFHCADNLVFDKATRYMIINNVLGTKHVLELCKQLSNLAAMVCTSTLACHFPAGALKEQVYKMPLSAMKLLEVTEQGNDSDVDKFVGKVINKWPNAYCFSKNVAENVLKEYKLPVPTAIVRTSLITPCWKGPIPGYVESNQDYIKLCTKIFRGFVRVIPSFDNKPIPNVPVDVAALTHIVAAWGVATQKLSKFSVLNCTREPGDTMEKFWEVVQKIEKYHSVPNAYLKPSLSVCGNQISYWLLSILFHYLPALVIDATLLYKGKTTMMMKGYNSYEKLLSNWKFYFGKGIKYDSKVFKSLPQLLEDKEKEEFYVDCSKTTLSDVTTGVSSGSWCFDWSTDKMKRSKRRWEVLRHTVLVRSINLIVYILLILLVYKSSKYLLDLLF